MPDQKKETVSDPKVVILCDDLVMETLVRRRSEKNVKRNRNNTLVWNLQTLPGW